jgi:hypothetical protein
MLPLLESSEPMLSVPVTMLTPLLESTEPMVPVLVTMLMHLLNQSTGDVEQIGINNDIITKFLDIFCQILYNMEREISTSVINN